MKPSQILVTLNVGRSGATDEVVEELRSQIKRRRIVKIRFPPPPPGVDRRAFCEELARRSGAILVDVRGHTAVFCDERHEARNS